MQLLDQELQPLKSEDDLIAGMDEAGRGPWAGPVTTAIVVLKKSQLLTLSQTVLNDSKVLSLKKRNLLFDIVRSSIVDFAIVDIPNTRIDETDILKATIEAMNKCYENLKVKPIKTFIDGYFNKPFPFDSECVIDGDAKMISIAAASILAKVHRDEIMEEYGVKYPEYGFEKHKGYGTKVHMEALGKYGPCEIHRKSFKPVAKYL